MHIKYGVDGIEKWVCEDNRWRRYLERRNGVRERQVDDGCEVALTSEFRRSGSKQHN